MGPMNRNKRLSLSESAINALVDPRTGTALRPLGVVGGRTIWPMLGASPDDASSEESKTDDEDKDSESDEAKSKEAEGADKLDPQAKITALESEKDRHVRRRREVEAERDEMKARLEELEGKDMPEVEKLTTKVKDLEGERDGLAESLRSSQLDNAFLKDNSYTWHNPGRALKLADLSDVEIDTDGTVHGLKEALDKLAKSDPYLIKQESDGKETEEEKPDTSKTQTSKSSKDKTKESEDAELARLRAKYPGLRR